VERDQVLVAADVDVADVDLGNGAPAGLLHHRHAHARIEVDPDLGNGGYALRTEESLGPDAKGATRRGVHGDRRRGAGHITSPPASRPSSTRRIRPAACRSP